MDHSRYEKSIILPKNKQEVIDEYTDSARFKDDFEKAKWSSQQSMLNRFHLAFKTVDWHKVETWMDVGCGTALFFIEAEKIGYKFDQLTGIDITPAVIEDARRKNYISQTIFYACDLENIPKEASNFDLVTMIGILQQCGSTPDVAIKKCAEKLNPHGQFFLTTKNLDWQEFKSGRLKPELTHSWFSYQEVATVFSDLKMKIIKSGGFLPHENKIVSIEESHTFFILAEIV